MHGTQKFLSGIAVALFFSFISIQAASAYSEDFFLKQGMRNSDVSELQQDLKDLGFFNASPTGYFGDITQNAVVKFQKRYGLNPDGIAGKQTIGRINSLLRRTAVSTASRGSLSRGQAAESGGIELLPWFGKVDGIYKIGDVATVTDVETGLKMQIKRTFGTNHADVETLTAEDTAILKKAAGGSWNWTRRPVLVEIDGYRIAASLTAMPHAGRDDKPALANVSGRSGDYGYGQNLDAVKGNGMDGQFDIHFYKSKTHGTNKIDTAHQAAIQKAYKSGL